MPVVLSTRPRKGALRADRAWSFFCGPAQRLSDDVMYVPFANWLWDQLGQSAGSLNADASGRIEITIPRLQDDALDLVLRLVSFWTGDVRLRKGRTTSANLWREPVVNLLRDSVRTGAERAFFRRASDLGSKELNLMPLLGSGRAFFSLQLIAQGDSTARMHSHSSVDEYYLILDGHGTLRFNGKAIPVGPGDLVAKPTGPDAATHLNADRGESLRILDMEIWHERFQGSAWTSKDLVYMRDHGELQLRGPGWSAVIPRDALLRTADTERHRDDFYWRTRNGKRKPKRSPIRAAKRSR